MTLRSSRDWSAIFVSTTLHDGGVTIEVKDNGPGMAPEVLQRIREPLFTTKSYSTSRSSAIEQIALQHGGKLDVQSVLGEGASFSIWLPEFEAEHLRGLSNSLSWAKAHENSGNGHDGITQGHRQQTGRLATRQSRCFGCLGSGQSLRLLTPAALLEVPWNAPCTGAPSPPVRDGRPTMRIFRG